MIPYFASILFTLYFITFGRFHIIFKVNFKPFNCTLCLASWTALALYFLPNEVSEVFIIMFGAGISTALLSKFFD